MGLDYDHEAKRLLFKIPHNRLSPDLHPLVIGSFFVRDEGHVVLDLRSIERALVAIPFFHSKIPRPVLRLEEAEVHNRVHQADRLDRPVTPADFFDRQVTPLHDFDIYLREVGGPGQATADTPERFAVAAQSLLDRNTLPLPEIERLPIHFYEEGTEGLESGLQLRQVVAMEHWRGNPGYSLSDAIRSFATFVADLEGVEWGDDWDDDEDDDDPRSDGGDPAIGGAPSPPPG